MRAVRYHRYGPPEVLQVEDATEPHPPAGAVRIRVAAASVNPIDLLVRGGHLRHVLTLPFPIVPGRDAAGAVDEIGERVDGVAVGDVVFGLGGTQDTFAEFAVLTAWAAVPTEWTPAQAAAAGLAGATAWAALDAAGSVAGRTVLLEGAAGAVGAATAALALDRGARVIGTARRANHAFLAGLGVIPTEYGPGLRDRVAELSPDGVDLAIDAAGAGSLDELLAVAGDADCLATVADAPGAERLGVRLVFAQNDSRSLQAVARLGGRGSYTPRIADELDVSRVVEAHTLAERGSGAGKIAVTGF